MSYKALELEPQTKELERRVTERKLCHALEFGLGFGLLQHIILLQIKQIQNIRASCPAHQSCRSPYESFQSLRRTHGPLDLQGKLQLHVRSLQGCKGVPRQYMPAYASIFTGGAVALFFLLVSPHVGLPLLQQLVGTL